MADPENDPQGARPGAVAAEAPDTSDVVTDDEPVPKLGRGRHHGKWSYYFPPQQVISLFALVIGLIAVLALRDSCSRGAGNFIQAFGPDAGPADAGAALVPRP